VQEQAGFHRADGLARRQLGKRQPFVFQVLFWIGFAEFFQSIIGGGGDV
jgi:hypothetical protein